MKLYVIIFVSFMLVACPRKPLSSEERMDKMLDDFNADAGRYTTCIVQTPCSCAALYKYIEGRKNTGNAAIDRMFNSDTFKTQNKNYKHKLNVIWNGVLVARAGEKRKK